MLLNLAAKLDVTEPERSDVEQAQQREYLQALPAEQARLANLPEDERRRRLDVFKESFFTAGSSQHNPSN